MILSSNLQKIFTYNHIKEMQEVFFVVVVSVFSALRLPLQCAIYLGPLCSLLLIPVISKGISFGEC